MYELAKKNFTELKRDAPLVVEETPSFYLYRLHMGSHVQTGIAACYSIDEYDRGLIKKHEKTRPDKEDDRTKHMLAIGAQTGPVFLTYRASHAVDAIVTRVVQQAPLFDFTAVDGVRHEVWQVPAARTRRSSRGSRRSTASTSPTGTTAPRAQPARDASESSVPRRVCGPGF